MHASICNVNLRRTTIRAIESIVNNPAFFVRLSIRHTIIVHKIVITYCSKVTASIFSTISARLTLGYHIEVVVEILTNILLDFCIVLTLIIVFTIDAKHNLPVVMAFNPELNPALSCNLQTISRNSHRLTVINANFYIQRWLLVINVREHNRYNGS